MKFYRFYKKIVQNGTQNDFLTCKEAEMLAQHHKNAGDKENIWTDPNSCFSDLSDSMLFVLYSLKTFIKGSLFSFDKIIHMSDE